MRNAPHVRSTAAAPRRTGPAFTALILVVLVAALLATVAWPTAARSSNRADAEEVMALVRADMEQAFARAGVRGRPVSIQFDPRHLHYDVRDPDTGELLAERRLTSAATHPLRSMWVSRGRVTVNENGVASAPYWIHLGWGHGDHRWILVQRSGRIREWGWR